MKFPPYSAAVAVGTLLAVERATAVEASSSVDGSRSQATLPCETGDDGTLNVHLVPHTHDDVGWLKTPHQYYYGFNNTIQNCAVKYILDTAIAALAQNPNRTFTYVEMAFFDMWWREQSGETKTLVKRLVQSGQLSFVNGGWCMHDEAATHYMGMIDQTTLGHDFLLRELDYIPRVGWQLDPFGHSATQASLLSSKVGFDALYFGRIDYQDMQRRHDEQQCEGFWSPSSNLENTIFWGLTGSYDGNYGPPAGFCFDVHCDDDYLIGQDDAMVRARITELVKFLKVQSDRTKGSNIMLTMGEDFNYENSLTWYENMEKMVSSLLALQASGKVDVASILAPRFNKINIFYSSPDTYTQCKFKEIKAAEKLDGPYETKTDDFFPYSDRPNGFWTGYFTSRPALKRLERVGSSFLLAARQTQALRGADAASLDVLDRAMGTAQHHDAVSGTSKQHVAYDYAKQIQAGINDAKKSVVETLQRYFVADPGDLSNLALCQLRNETICNVTQRATQVPGSNIYLVVYNALAQQRDEYVTVPVAVGAKYKVSRLVKVREDEETWQDVKSAVIPNKNYCGVKASADYVLHFQAKELPAVGAAVYRIEMVPSRDKSDLLRQTNLAPPTSQLRRMLQLNEEEQISISSGQIEAKFSNGGILTHVCSTSAEEGKEVCQSVHQEWGFYISFDSTKHAKSKEDTENSGAYIFRPSDPNQELQIIGPDQSKAFVFKSDVVTEVHSSMEGGWIHQITRVHPGRDYVEIEYTVGPIPIDDGLGKEVVTRYICPSIENGGTFYTDSNGREFMKRQRSHRPTWNLTEYQPVAGNYYPINAAIYVEDEDTSSMSIVVDRSQGGGSITDGSIEIMVHRRTLVDDFRGVNEPINETDSGMTHYPPYGHAKRIGNGLIITGKHRLSLSTGRSGASISRSLMDRVFSEPLVFASSSHQNVNFRKSVFSAIDSSFELPENIMLITFHQIASTETSQTLLIRLGHQYGRGEDQELSKAVDIDFKHILPGYEIQSITERTLSGNQDLSEREEKILRWNEAAEDISDASGRGITQDGTITIHPMDIRTFHVKVGV